MPNSDQWMLSKYNPETWLTCKEAASLIGYTQRHITNLIAKGKLSAEHDNGKYFIQKAEFFRVYPNALKMEVAGTKEKNTNKKALDFLEEQVRYLQEIITEKRKHNEYLMEQIQVFTEEKSKMLDAINSHARLLEHKEVVGKNSAKTIEIKGKKKNWIWPFKKN